MSRFLLISVLITAVALGYVHQQVGLLKINYAINRNRDNLSVLLDQNSTLMYNVVSCQSPSLLVQALETQVDNWEIPSRWYTIGSAEAAR